jgi:hypothetical protein
MARRPKAKPKPKSQRNTDTAQSERFKETARNLGADESGETFERVFSKIVQSKRSLAKHRV